MMNTRKNFLIIASVVAMVLIVSIYLLATSSRHVTLSATIPGDKKLATISPLSIDPPEKDLPTFYNAPVQLSRTDTLKIRKFLSQYRRDHSLDTSFSGYYRKDSSRTATSGSFSLFVDLPLTKQTLRIQTNPNDTLDISCALPTEQKEAGWSCSDDALGESE